MRQGNVGRGLNFGHLDDLISIDFFTVPTVTLLPLENVGKVTTFTRRSILWGGPGS
jgi:hypothetical protein